MHEFEVNHMKFGGLHLVLCCLDLCFVFVGGRDCVVKFLFTVNMIFFSSGFMHVWICNVSEWSGCFQRISLVSFCYS